MRAVVYCDVQESQIIKYQKLGKCRLEMSKRLITAAIRISVPLLWRSSHTVQVGLYLTHGADWSDGIGLYCSVYTTLRGDIGFEAEDTLVARLVNTFSYLVWISRDLSRPARFIYALAWIEICCI